MVCIELSTPVFKRGVMRIYAVADIHGRPERFSAVKSVISLHAPDLLIMAGDMTSYFRQQAFVDFLKHITVPCAGILGNTDFTNLRRKLRHNGKFHFLNQAPLTIQGRRFTGMDGTLVLPFSSRICFFERQRLETILPVVTPDSILVVHTPPRGCLDKVAGRFSAGSTHLARFVRYRSPLLLICGHIHEQAGFEIFHRTMVVNCAMNTLSAGALIDISNDSSVNVTQLTKED